MVKLFDDAQARAPRTLKISTSLSDVDGALKQSSRFRVIADSGHDRAMRGKRFNQQRTLVSLFQRLNRQTSKAFGFFELSFGQQSPRAGIVNLRHGPNVLELHEQ